MIRKHSLELAVILAMIILLFFAYGCGGTRQVTSEKHSNIEIQNSYHEGSKIVLGNTFTYTPFDALKPMKIEGKEYVNVIIKSYKSKTITKWKDRNITKTIVIEKTKQTEKKDNTILWIGLSFVVILGILAWFKLPGFK